MQDKEFDKLFKDRFEEAEIEPSANLWGKIATKLEPRKKRVLPTYWMAAAAVVLVTLTIALLSPKTEKIRLHGSALTAENVQPVQAGKITPAKNNPETDQTGSSAEKSTPLIIAPRLKFDNSAKKDLIAMQPNAPVNHPDSKPPETVQQPVNEKPAAVATPVKEVMIASVANEENADAAVEETQPEEHRRIRNVGDLVNFVVNKVDKREKKFIQFNTDDDDNSSLVALNIGILRFNKKSDK